MAHSGRHPDSVVVADPGDAVGVVAPLARGAAIVPALQVVLIVRARGRVRRERRRWSWGRGRWALSLPFAVAANVVVVVLRIAAETSLGVTPFSVPNPPRARALIRRRNRRGGGLRGGCRPLKLPDAVVPRADEVHPIRGVTAEEALVVTRNLKSVRELAVSLGQPPRALGRSCSVVLLESVGNSDLGLLAKLYVLNLNFLRARSKQAVSESLGHSAAGVPAFAPVVAPGGALEGEPAVVRGQTALVLVIVLAVAWTGRLPRPRSVVAAGHGLVSRDARRLVLRAHIKVAAEFVQIPQIAPRRAGLCKAGAEILLGRRLRREFSRSCNVKHALSSPNELGEGSHDNDEQHKKSKKDSR